MIPNAKPATPSAARMALSWLVVVTLGCAPPNEYQPPAPPEVTVATPLVQTVTDYLEETGSTEAKELVKIRARVRGFIEQIKFNTEDRVSEGDLLYVVEKKVYQAEVDKAKAALAVAQAEFLNADARYKTAVPLAEKGVVTREELDQRKAERSVAQASIYAAQANLKAAQIDLDYCEIKTPISGRVGKTLVKIGNLVDGNEATHLTSVVNYDEIYANFNVSERTLQQIRKDADYRGEDGQLDKESVKMYLSRFIDGDKYPFEGHLDYWGTEVEESTGTYPIRGLFKNPDEQLIPGMTVKIRVPMTRIDNALLVPEGSIGTDQRGRYVLVINAENKVERRGVTPGAKFGGMQVVLDGLTKDDRVVIKGLQRARLDAEVNPVEETLPPLKTDGVRTFRSEGDDGEPVEPPPAESVDEAAAAVFEEESTDDAKDSPQ